MLLGTRIGPVLHHSHSRVGRPAIASKANRPTPVRAPSGRLRTPGPGPEDCHQPHYRISRPVPPQHRAQDQRVVRDGDRPVRSRRDVQPCRSYRVSAGSRRIPPLFMQCRRDRRVDIRCTTRRPQPTSEIPLLDRPHGSGSIWIIIKKGRPGEIRAAPFSFGDRGREAIAPGGGGLRRRPSLRGF